MYRNLADRAYLCWLRHAYAQLCASNPLHADITYVSAEIQRIDMRSRPIDWDEVALFFLWRALWGAVLVSVFQWGRLAP